jgi:hypothetical protein
VNARARLAGVAVVAGLLAGAGGYVAGQHHAPAPVVQTCPAPALAGQHAGYVAGGSKIIGTNGANGIAPGDVYTCDMTGNASVS